MFAYYILSTFSSKQLVRLDSHLKLREINVKKKQITHAKQIVICVRIDVDASCDYGHCNRSVFVL